MYIDHAVLITQLGGWPIISLGQTSLMHPLDYLQNPLPQITTNEEL
jgi:hypothetical protein